MGKQITVDLTFTGNIEMPPLEAAFQFVPQELEKYPKPYNLMVSGGADSQAMLLIFKHLGIHFNCYTARYENDYNKHDLVQLFQFCRLHGIHINIIDFNFQNFIDTEYHRYAIKYECSSPQIMTHARIGEDLEGTRIYAGNFIAALSSYTFAQRGLYRYAEKSGKSIIPSFLSITPELAYSTEQFLNDVKSGSSHDDKVKVYHAAGLPIIPQEKKYTGFEKIKEDYEIKFAYKVTTQIKLMSYSKNNRSRQVFDMLLRYPYEDMIGDRSMRYLITRNGKIHTITV
jgi:hypothetical protein